MTDFAAARRMMVDGQVRTADVTDPRHALRPCSSCRASVLCPQDKAALAYLDLDVPVSEAGQPVRRLLKPMVLAKLIQAADVAETDRVLDVGCATGYSTALLARLAGSVVGARGGRGAGAAGAPKRSRRAGLTERQGCDGSAARTAGPPAAPYDVIVLQGAAEIVPQALFDQLKDGGRLVVRARARSGRQGHAVPAHRRRIERPSGVRCRGRAAAGLRQAAGVRVLAAPAFTDRGVAHPPHVGNCAMPSYVSVHE